MRKFRISTLIILWVVFVGGVVAQENKFIKLIKVKDLRFPFTTLSYNELGDTLVIEGTVSYDKNVDRNQAQEEENLYEVKKVVKLDKKSGTFNILDKPNSAGKWVINNETLNIKNQRRINKIQPRKENSLQEDLNYIAPDGTWFEDRNGNRLKPGQLLRTYDATIPNIYINMYKDYEDVDKLSQINFVDDGVLGLYACTENGKVEVVTPELNPIRVEKFYYDHMKKRVFVQNRCIMYDIVSRESKKYPTYDINTKTHIRWYMIPGHDALLSYNEQMDDRGHSVVNRTFYLCDLEGNIKQDIPLTYSESGYKHFPMNVTCSQDMVAYTFLDHSKTYVRVLSINK